MILCDDVMTLVISCLSYQQSCRTLRTAKERYRDAISKTHVQRTFLWRRSVVWDWAGLSSYKWRFFSSYKILRIGARTAFFFSEVTQLIVMLSTAKWRLSDVLYFVTLTQRTFSKRELFFFGRGYTTDCNVVMDHDNLVTNWAPAVSPSLFVFSMSSFT